MPSTKRKEILIAVCGTTGVGKSALALKLAQTLNASHAYSIPSRSSVPVGIINGDSLQVYKGLDIVTNKPSKKERAACPHYLFDFVHPTEEYSVGQFKQDADQIIKDIHENHGIPIVVGGTNYYIQSLLWDKMIQTDRPESIGLSNKGSVRETCHESIRHDAVMAKRLCFLLEGTDPRLHSAYEILTFSKLHSLHDTLCLVDPLMSKRWHPKDYRKLRRSLEIYYTTGKTQSEWYKQQNEQGGQKIRYPTILIWLYGKPDILDPRLDARVDAMLDNGLLDEIEEMRGKCIDNQVVGVDSNYTRGVLQAIGFKEFHEYFHLKEARSEDLKAIDDAFAQGVEKMKLATRQYARQQIQWLKNKLGPAILEDHAQESGAFYVIDASDPKAVTEQIIQKTIELVNGFVNGDPNQSWSLMAPQLEQLMEIDERETNWDLFECPYCIDRETGSKRIFAGQKVWNLHCSSRQHKKQVSYSVAGPKPKAGDKDAWLQFSKRSKPTSVQ